MSNEVLPAPEKLNGTKNCELAALLVTLNFEPVDDAMTIAQGDGIVGGRLGYWRFLPIHPQRRYHLGVVTQRGLDPYQASKRATPLLPVYKEQAYIAAVFHNRRLLIESITNGTRLRLDRVGFLYLFHRVEAQAVAEVPAAPALREFMKASTRRVDLVAALATLGFEPEAVRTPAAPFAGRAITHEAAAVAWLLPERSRDGMWQLGERMARWADDAWCSREDNCDPIACMADACWNLNHLRRSLADAARVLIRVANGRRSVLLDKNAPDSEWDKAADFLKGKLHA